MYVCCKNTRKGWAASGFGASTSSLGLGGDFPRFLWRKPQHRAPGEVCLLNLWNFLHSWKFRVTTPWSVWCGVPWQIWLGPSRAQSSCLLRLRTLLRPWEKPLFLYPGFSRSISKKKKRLSKERCLTLFCFRSSLGAFSSAGLPERSHPSILH